MSCPPKGPVADQVSCQDSVHGSERLKATPTYKFCEFLSHESTTAPATSLTRPQIHSISRIKMPLWES